MTSIRRWVAPVALSWLAMIGVDLALQAGLLARLYDWGSPFLLTPADAFARIPIGYLSFLVLAIALAWLLPRSDVHTARDGALTAGLFGAVIWAALLIGLWSISTADLTLLAGWWIGQTVELSVGGFVMGSVLSGARLRSVAWKVGALVVVGAVVAVVLQSLGYATAPGVVK